MWEHILGARCMTAHATHYKWQAATKCHVLSATTPLLKIPVKVQTWLLHGKALTAKAMQHHPRFIAVHTLPNLAYRAWLPKGRVVLTQPVRTLRCNQAPGTAQRSGPKPAVSAPQAARAGSPR